MNHFTPDSLEREFVGAGHGPVLMVIILLLVSLGLAVFAVWLGTSSGTDPRKAALFYVVGISRVDRNRESI
jgi:hypothetical protein